MSRRSSVAPLFAALGDETRLSLLARLSERRALSITRLHRGSRMTRQAVTKHLHVLRKAGLARATRRGREQIWRLEPDRFDVARRYLDDVSSRWDEALDRLKAHLEKTRPTELPGRK